MLKRKEEPTADDTVDDSSYKSLGGYVGPPSLGLVDLKEQGDLVDPFVPRTSCPWLYSLFSLSSITSLAKTKLQGVI